MNISKYFINNQNILFILLGVFSILIALYPFWLFGEYSSLGWYDEMDAQIPWNYVNNQKDNFYYSWAGGVGSYFGYGIEKISFYRFLLDIFPLWIANNIIRFLSLFTLFLGIYIFNKKFFNIPSYLAFSSAIFAIFATPYPYGWTLGGMGFDLSIAVWLSIAFFVSFKNQRTNYIIGFGIVLIGPTVSSFVFSFVLTFFLAASILISYFTKIEVHKDKIFLWLSISCLYILLMLFNWSGMSYHMNEAKEFSTRLMGIFETKHVYTSSVSDFIGIVKEEWQLLQKYLDRFSHPIMSDIFLIIVFLAVIKKQYTALITTAIVIIFIPIIFIAFTQVYEMGVFSTYRWNIIWMLIPIVSSIVIAGMLSNSNFMFIKNDNLAKGTLVTLVIITSFILVWKSYQGGKILSDITIHNLHYRSGNAISFYYNDLKKLDSGNYRVITDTSRLWWALPMYYGMDSFDGIQAAMPHRRTYFLAYGLSKHSTDIYHHTKHFFYFKHDKVLYDVKLLEMANIKYILSHSNNIAYEIDKVMTIDSLKVSDIWNKEEISYNNFSNLVLANPLFVYKLKQPWDRVFVAKNIILSNNSFKEKSFYKELKNLEKHEILIAVEDRNNNIEKSTSSLLEIKAIDISDNTITVKTNKQEGYIVLNQVYTPQWKAFCDGKEIEIIPSNGIMMSAKVDKGCEKLVLKYSIEN